MPEDQEVCAFDNYCDRTIIRQPTLSAPDGMIVSRRRREICQSEVRDSARGRLKFYPE